MKTVNLNVKSQELSRILCIVCAGLGLQSLWQLHYSGSGAAQNIGVIKEWKTSPCKQQMGSQTGAAFSAHCRFAEQTEAARWTLQVNGISGHCFT